MSSKTINFQITDWFSGDYEDEEDSDMTSTEDSDESGYYKPVIDKTKYKVYIFGKDDKDKTYTVQVTGFTPYFYIKLPDGPKKYNTATSAIIMSYVKSQLYKKYRECLLGVTILYKHSFRNFDNKKKYRFARLKFSNHAAMKKAVNIFQNSNYNEITGNTKRYPKKILIPNIPGGTNSKWQYDLYENNIDPLLKFIHHMKIKPSGWIQILPGKYYELDRDSGLGYTSDYIIQADWKSVKPQANNNNCGIKILAYDIECDSSHGDFPLPNKDYTKLAREIYNSYMKIYNQNIKLINEDKIKHKTKINKNKKELENKVEFAKKRIKAAFTKGGSEELEISEIFPKNKPSPNDIKVQSEHVAKFLTINMDANSIERKKHSTKSISNINTALCNLNPDIRNMKENLDQVNSNILFLSKKLSKIEKEMKTSSEKDAKLLDKRRVQIKKDYEQLKREYDSQYDQYKNIFSKCVYGDQTVQIGMSFLKFGQPQSQNNIMLTYDPTGTCDDISNANLETFKTETDLLIRFKDIIMEEDPDIITGWNTDGFDTPWLFKRAEELNIEEEFNHISKFTNIKSYLKKKQVKGPTGELITKEFVDIPGRIQMDILPLVQKSYNLDSYKLDNVSANFINGKIKQISYDSKTNKSAISTSTTEGLNVGNYIIISKKEGYLEQKYKDGDKFQIKEIDHEKNIVTLYEHIDIEESVQSQYSWCLGKDDVSPQEIFQLQKGGSKDRSKLAYYCMMDVILCHELLLKLAILTNNIGMANVCLNPLSWIIQRGQGIKILSLTSYFLKQNDYLLPYLYKDSFDKEGFEGAVVLDPKPAIYINKPVAVLDYGSLYPSSMIERNLSHDSIISEDDVQYLGDEGAQRIKDMGYFGHEDIKYDVFKTTYTSTGNVKGKEKIGTKTVRFVQYSDPKDNGEKGIIPNILRYLLKARKTTRNKIKYKTVTCKDGSNYIGIYNKDDGTVTTPEDKWSFDPNDVVSVKDTYTDFQKQNLDGEQLAYKITANSLYGGIGAKTSDIYYKEIAASTTATGRERLIIAQEYAEDKYNYPQTLANGETIYLQNEVVYGDTDSVFVHFQTLDDNGKVMSGRDARKKSIELAIYTEKQIQKHKLRHPQVLEYEKTFDPFILFSKKRYVGDLYEIDPDKCVRKSMGIVLKRRDNATIVKIIYGGIIDIIMKQKKITPAIDFLRNSLRDLVRGKFDMETLILSKTLSSYYKDPDRIAHKVLADRMAERDPGNKPQVNDRIPFVYIDTSHIKQKGAILQGDKIEHPEYIKEHKLTPDYEFYITNQILNPVSQIFGLCLEELPGFTKNIKEFDSIKTKQLALKKSSNDANKKMYEARNKEAGNILFKDILRILENKRTRNKEITAFFTVRKQ